MNRQEYNRKIISKLNKIVEEYPDLRFGQILWNCGILYWEDNKYRVHDPYSDESRDIWNRMNKF